MTDESKKVVLAYQGCLTSENGKIMFADLKRVFKFDMSVVPIGDDAHIDVNRLIRNEGQRSVLIHMITQMSKDLISPESKPQTEPAQNFIE
jgi:hypothetical protein